MSESAVWQVLGGVMDPEIPVVSIVELGIVRSVAVSARAITVRLSPTYAGCPATDAIAADVRAALRARWPQPVVVEQVLSPPWTTDWISPSGRAKLRASGIAPPERHGPVGCPRCGSVDTRAVSQFGSTPCKAAYVCDACLEPFEKFKCL